MSAYAGNKPNFLNQLVSHGKLTPDGRDWLTLSLDPFHDLNHQAAGYPDSDGSQTVVSCYQYQLDVTAPASDLLDENGLWDAHVFTLPLSNTGDYAFFDQAANWLTLPQKANLQSAVLGILNVVTTKAGNPLIPDSANVPSTETTALPPNGNLETATGVTRIIGYGYEVTNTTADIHKQGSVTSYRMPQNASPVGTVLMIDHAASVFQSVVTHRRIHMPPATVSQANLLKGTRTWDAAAGVYATAVQNSVANPLLQMSNESLLLSPSAAPTAYPTEVMMTNYTAFPSSPAAVYTSTIADLTQLTPHDTTGSMFTGLSAQTTLTVKLKVYVERAPSYIDAQLAVLATPSAGYDVTALELYSHAISQLPVAVTVSENGLGDWFKGVVNVVKQVAGGAGALLNPFIPGAQQVGTAVQGIAGGFDRLLGSTSRNAPAGQPTTVMSLMRPMRSLTLAAQPKPRKKSTRTVKVVPQRRPARPRKAGGRN